MQFLGKNITHNDPDSELNCILQNLVELPKRGCFGNLSFSGKFSIREIIFSYIQNFSHGIFTQIYFPIRKLKIKSIKYCDLSPNDHIFPDIHHPYWQEFLNNFEQILNDYNLNINDFCQHGIGDTSFEIGWTKNYEETEYIDFIDITIKSGIIAPTGKKKDEDKVFSLPLGYNGHVGIPVSLDLATGLYEWLTIGGHFDIIWFARKNKDMRIKTAKEQSGFIKLAKTCTNIKKGTLYNLGFYLEADHIAGGLSLLIGYTFSEKQKDTLTFSQPLQIDCKIANSDEMLKEWNQHTIHFMIEYDFTKEEYKIGPRLNFFYNLAAGGKRIFKTNISSAGFGLDIDW